MGSRGIARAVAGALAAGALVLAGCSAQTDPADGVGTTTATLHGTVSWKSSEHGDFHWEYSKDGSGVWTAVGGGKWGDSNSSCDGSGTTYSASLSQPVTGLTPNTDYVFRIAGTLCGSSTVSSDSLQPGGDEYDFFRTQANCTSTISPGGDLQAFAASLSAGQVGCLHGGTYTQPEVDVRNNGVTLTSYPGERATIKGTLKTQGNDVAITRLNLDGAGGASGGLGPFVYGDRDVFYGDDVTNEHTEICFLVGGNFGTRQTGDVIEASKIHDCGKVPSDNKDHGMYVQDTSGAVIRGNWIYNNTDRGIQLYPDADGTQIYGNVIDGNGEGVEFSACRPPTNKDCTVLETSDNNVVRNNVISGDPSPDDAASRWNAEEGAQGTGTGNVFKNNCVWATNPNSYYDSNGGVQLPDVSQSGNEIATSDPYVNRSGRDYRLVTGGPCVPKLADIFNGTAP